MNPPPPIVFLVRQQAKSVVAIHELEDRVRTLEDVQEGVFNAVHDLQEQYSLTAASYSDRSNPFYPRTRVPQKFAKSAFEPVTPIARYSEMPVNQSDTKKKDDFGKGDENKQDSGVDSDCQNPMSLSTTLPLPRHKIPVVSSYPENGASIATSDQDELSLVLDELALRGAALRRKLQFYESQHARLAQDNAQATGGIASECVDNVGSSSFSALFQRCKILEDKLQEFISENDFLGKKTVEMQSVIDKLQLDKSLLEEKMEGAIKDRQQLEKTIHSFHSRFQKTSSDKKLSDGSVRPVLKKHEESKLKVQTALKEKEPLELQKQLMLCIIENEVLLNKNEMTEKMRLSVVEDGARNEAKLRERIRNLTLEKQQVSELAERRKKEIEQVKSQLSIVKGKLEQMEQHHLNTPPRRDVSKRPFGLNRNRTNQLLSMVNFSSRNRDKDCQSLPPTLTRDIETTHYVYEIQPLKDTSSYLNITSDYPADLLEIEEEGSNDCYDHVLSSTPITKRASKNEAVQNGPLMDVWATGTEDKQTSTTLLNKSEMESICSEFDPFSSQHPSLDNCDKNQSGYVDSLDQANHALTKDDVFNFDVSAANEDTHKPKGPVLEPLILYSNKSAGDHVVKRHARNSQGSNQLVVLKEDDQLL